MLKDSIIDIQGAQIANLNAQIETLDNQVIIQTEQYDLLARKKRRQKWVAVGTGVIGGVLGFILGGL